MMKFMSGMSGKGKGGKTGIPPQVIAAYCLFMVGAATVWHLVADGAFSSILTLSVLLQCLAVALLGLQMLATGSAAGISVRALTLDLIGLCFRLSSTLRYNGYLPVDASGDHLFQAIDISSLLIIIWLIYNAVEVRSETYQAEADSMPITPMIVLSLIFAALLHGNLNSRPVFDTLWMAGLFVSTVAVLPQLWLITRTGGKIEALTSHYIAAMAVSRVLSGVFMWHARHDVTCVPWVSGFNHAIWAILGAHVIHVILLGDFVYYYIKAVISRGLDCRLEILQSCGV